MNPAPFSSILFERPSDEVQREDPSMFRDLNLDQVFAAVASGRAEYDLMLFFAAPLRDVRAVEYRHEVQRDLADDTLSKAVAEFTLAMHEMRENLGLAGRSAIGTRRNAGSWTRPASTVRRSRPWRTRSPRSIPAPTASRRSGGISRTTPGLRRSPA